MGRHKRPVWPGKYFEEIRGALMLGGMGWLVEVGDALVAAIHRHGVLHEIIGADAEEFGFLGQLVRDERGGRQFDHGADFDVVAVGDTAVGEFLFAFLEVRVGAAEFVDLSDHRIHQPDLPVVCGAQDGAELRFEKVRLGQTEADSPAAEKRIVLAVMA